MDIRIYHSKSGNLLDIHQDVIDNTQNSSGDITVTCMDSMHRKIYIADTKGGLAVFNLNNGIKLNTLQPPRDLNEMAILAQLDAAIQHNRQLIPHNHRTIKENDDLSSSEDEFRSSTFFGGANTVTSQWRTRLLSKGASAIKSQEISALYFSQRDRILVTGSQADEISIYDEGRSISSSEEKILLRTMKGVHIESPITCLDANQHLSLIASGSTNGQIAFWDYEFCFLDGLCKAHNGQLSAIKFLEKRFPGCVSAGYDGIVCIWGIRKAHSDLEYQCLARIQNGLQDVVPVLQLHTEFSLCKESEHKPSLIYPQQFKPIESDYWLAKNLKLYRKLLQQYVKREQDSRQSKHSFGGVSSIESSGKKFK